MSDKTEILYNDICELLEHRKFNTLRDLITEMNEVDIAELIDEATPEQAVIIFRLLPKQLAAEAFAYMDKFMAIWKAESSRKDSGYFSATPFFISYPEKAEIARAKYYNALLTEGQQVLNGTHRFMK